LGKESLYPIVHRSSTEQEDQVGAQRTFVDPEEIFANGNKILKRSRPTDKGYKKQRNAYNDAHKTMKILITKATHTNRKAGRLMKIYSNLAVGLVR